MNSPAVDAELARPAGPPPGTVGRAALLATLLVAIAAAIAAFSPAIRHLFDLWNVTPEYSHGILIPPIALMLIWRERAWLARTEFRGSWWGLLLVVLGFGMYLAGELSAIQVIVQYGFVFVLYGLVLGLAGWTVVRRLWMPLLLLLFMIPPPAFFLNNLSLRMQLVSSVIGVEIVRMAGISVFLQGNVIDLGAYKLQVAEACDGLRYMFPLMTLGFVLAYFYRAPMWKRLALFASSVPISILMNSLRIGVIGITVEHWGERMAEGILHEFQGWLVFMFSAIGMLGTCWLLNRFGAGRGRSVLDTLAVDFGAPVPAGGALPRGLRPAFLGAAMLTVAGAAFGILMPERTELVPERSSFTAMPLQFGSWNARPGRLDRIYLDALQLDDYMVADFSRPGPGSLPVNLYVAWYDSQRSGRSVHSPRSCMPGGGWAITSFETTTLEGLGPGGTALPVNRAIIQLGEHRQLVYYLFDQRGRKLTNEYLVKWYIFVDSITRKRTDGSLVRFTVPMPRGTTETQAEEAFRQFAAMALPALAEFVPD